MLHSIIRIQHMPQYNAQRNVRMLGSALRRPVLGVREHDMAHTMIWCNLVRNCLRIRGGAPRRPRGHWPDPQNGIMVEEWYHDNSKIILHR